MDVVLTQCAPSIERPPVDGTAGEMIAAKGATGAQQATEAQQNHDLAWLGVAICACSTAGMCGVAYLLADILFF